MPTFSFKPTLALTRLVATMTFCAAFSTMHGQSISTTNVGSNQVTLQLTSNTTSTGYFVLLQGTGSACGTATQTASGQNGQGNTVPHGSYALEANTERDYTVRNLLANTTYTACFTNDGTSTPISKSFQTSSAASFSPAAWTLVGPAGITTGSASYTSLAFAPDGTPYLAFRDTANSSKMRVMKYSSDAWSDVGNADFSTGSAAYSSLAFSPDGVPYVAYSDAGSSNKATVMRLNGSQWEMVGGAPVSVGIGTYTSLAFSPDGVPYLSYWDSGSTKCAVVMKFDGSVWSLVGGTPASSGNSAYNSLVFGPDGSPYVAYADSSNSSKATVMKYNGTQWVVVGTAGFSASTASYDTLRFSADGTLYLGYQDANSSYAATVAKFDGTQWSTVGTAGFTPGRADYFTMAISPEGSPVVAFEDGANSYKASAMYFDGTNWENLGAPGFSGGIIYYTTLSFSPAGVPYAAFYDSANSGKATIMSLQVVTAPSVTTGTAANITSSSATLNAVILDNGFATSTSFEYGTSTAYGTQIAASTGGTIAAGTGSTASSVSISGLSSNTLYHFRANATGNSNTSNGADQTFTTDKLAPSITAWPSASSITYGQTLSSSTLSGGTASVAGTFAWTAPTTAPPAGTTSYAVTFTPTDTANYASVQSTVAITINKATPTVSTWPSAASITAGLTLASSTLTGGTASVAGNFAWTDPTTTANETTSYSVTFTPTDTTNYQTVLGTTNLVTTKLSPTITLTSSVNPLFAQNATVFAVTIASATFDPSGTVTFMDGTTPLGTATLTHGAATLSVSSLSAGNHSITVSYSGDTSFAAATSSSLPQAVADFTLQTDTSSQTISSGGSASLKLTLSPTIISTMPASIALSISGLPTGASYTITPAAIAAGAASTTVPLTITVPNKTASLTSGVNASWAFGLLMLPMAIITRKKSRVFLCGVLPLLLLSSTFALIGCAGNSTESSTTTPQSYTLTITATSGALQHTTTSTLVVQ